MKYKFTILEHNTYVFPVCHVFQSINVFLYFRCTRAPISSTVKAKGSLCVCMHAHVFVQWTTFLILLHHLF